MTDVTGKTATLGEKIAEAVSFKTVFTIKLGALSIPISETVVTTWIVMAILIITAFLMTRRMKLVPKGSQIFLETFVGSINNFMKEQIGHHWKPFAPYLGTIGLFLGVANMISFISPVAGFGFVPLFTFKPPTRDINVTAAMAIMTIVIVIVSSIVYKGFIPWLKTFIKPAPFMLPFNLIEYIIKPLSLCLRLFGNILGAFIIMELIDILIPLFVPPVIGMYFDFFDGLIQAIVFTFLSTLYISEAVE
jgi:F-type H+-transporting ATPase subunit a